MSIINYLLAIEEIRLPAVFGYAFPLPSSTHVGFQDMTRYISELGAVKGSISK